MKFTISILTYTAGSLAKRCIESVIKNSPMQDVELILTDNGAPVAIGEHFEAVAKAHPNVTVFHNKRNEGFIDPNRRAFRMAQGKYLVLLNDDTTVPAGWLEALEAPFVMDKTCALSGPAGACCQLRNDFHGEIGPRFEYLEGSCLMIDTEKVRLLEPDLFPAELIGAYGEDSYLSLRVRSAGYSIKAVPLALRHVRAATSATVPQIREWQAHNHTFLMKRFAKYMKAHRFDFPIIIRRNAAWGDVLLTTPIVRALKARNSMARIQVETVCPEVYNGNLDVQYVARSVHSTSADTEEYNLNGISEMNPGMHIIDAYAKCVGLSRNEYDRVTRFKCLQGDIEWAERTVGVESWVALHPGPTAWRCKNWPFDRWEVVIAAIQEMGFKVVLVGSDALPHLKADHDLRKKTNVGQLGAILRECRLFVGLDSFPIHMAQAVGTPVVGLFGITDPNLILTDGSMWRAACSPPDHPGTGLRHKKPGTTHVDCPDNPMNAITVDAVIEQITRELCPTHV